MWLSNQISSFIIKGVGLICEQTWDIFQEKAVALSCIIQQIKHLHAFNSDNNKTEKFMWKIKSRKNIQDASTATLCRRRLFFFFA